MRWPRGGGSAPSALQRAVASAGLGGPGRRGAWPAASSPQRSALGCALSLRPHGRAGGRAIEGRHRGREARGGAEQGPRLLAGQTPVSAAAGEGVPGSLKSPARAGGRGRGGSELSRVPRAVRGARGPPREPPDAGLPGGPRGNFARAGRAGRCKLSGGRGTPGIKASASGWRWCPRLLCVTSGPGRRVHQARSRGLPAVPPTPPQPGPGRARSADCLHSSRHAWAGKILNGV